MIEKSKMTNNNNNNNDNKTDYDNDGINKTTTTTTTTTISTSPEEQKQFESKAVAKESAAVQKASKTFAELTSKISSIGEGQDDGGEELKQTVRLLVMAENTDALTAVLTRLNGDRQAWETAQRQPVALIAMIIEEQQKRMTELQKKLQTQLTTTNNNNDNNNKK